MNFSRSSMGLHAFQGILHSLQKAPLCNPCLRNELSPLSQEGHPAAAAQFAANVQGELLVFLIVVLPPVEVMIAVSPGCVSCTHWELSVQTLDMPSCNTTVVWPRCDRISRTVPRTPIEASGVVIL